MAIKHTKTAIPDVDKVDCDDWNANHTIDSDVPFNNNKATGVKDPTLDQDAATKKYVDDTAAPTPPAGNNGEVQFNDAGSFGADSNLFWDDVNKRLGIGTAGPLSFLSVGGVGNATYSIYGQGVGFTSINGVYGAGIYGGIGVRGFSSAMGAGTGVSGQGGMMGVDGLGDPALYSTSYGVRGKSSVAMEGVAYGVYGEATAGATAIGGYFTSAAGPALVTGTGPVILDLASMPVADPNVAGQLWRDGTDLKISLG